VLPHLKRRLGAYHPDTLAAFEWMDYLQGKTDDRSGEPGPNPPAREGGASRGRGRGFGVLDRAPLSEPQNFLVRPYAVTAGRTETRVLTSTAP
jgi:hypothetical protein